MATGIVITVAEKLFAVLTSQELKEICSMFGYESQLDELRRTMSTINAVLLDAESKHQGLTHEGRDWIEKLKDAVYDVDDLLDKFNTMSQKEKRKRGGKISQKVCRFFSRSNQFLIAFNMSQKIQNIRGKLDKIAKDRQQFGFSDVYVPIKRRDKTNSFASENSIIGREADKDAIVGMLLKESETSNDAHSKVSFVTIVGIGGLGKTAVAQLVYNDERIIRAFDLRLWVCVSEEFGMEKILTKILRKECDIEDLQIGVRKLIEGKRYLLVLDDVWSENRNEWINLRSFLDLGDTRSRIIVTSRSKRVASVIGDRLMYELQGLSEENSWKLFQRMAFKQGNAPVDSDLTDIGKEILKKCVNVPLSIRVIGSMLYDQHKSKWISFKSIDLIKMGQADNRQDEDDIMPILKFSYYRLTPALKSCFSYCTLFPKDHMIQKEMLINLWLAQGCLDPPQHGQSIEDVGEEYFSILLHRCFFQDIVKDEYGEVVSCKMHDLIHDLAQEVAGKESSVLDYVGGQIDEKIRHLSLFDRKNLLLSTPCNWLGEMKMLRTLLLRRAWGWYTQSTDGSIVATIVANLRRLRVLGLGAHYFEYLPNQLGSLSHLRYLDLSYNWKLKILHKSITKLYNLQVLKLNETGVRELPKDFKNLVNLRHLDITECRHLTHMPAGMDTMTFLHTLTMFVVGGETSKPGKVGQLKDLKSLVSLRGRLKINFESGFGSVAANAEEGRCLLSKLKALEIEWKNSRHNGSDQATVHESSLENLQPHYDLMGIEIRGYNGVKLPTWAASLATSLPRLVKIHLDDFGKLHNLPSLSQLPHLKYLELGHMPNAEFIESDTPALASRTTNQSLYFPSLEQLGLWKFPKLKGWWRDDLLQLPGRTSTCLVNGTPPSVQAKVWSFPRLHTLSLQDCPSMTAFPRCPRLKKLVLLEFNKALRFGGREGDQSSTISSSSKICPSSFSSLNVSLNDNNCITEPMLYLEQLFVDDIGVLDFLFGEQESLQAVASLREIHVSCCHNLENLPRGVEHLTNLHTLKIENCGGFERMPWKSHPSTISFLSISGLDTIVNLPDELQYITTLQSLSITCCENLETLPEWLPRLASLRRLYIRRCPNLKSLPEAIRHLHSLKELAIWGSGELYERCRESDGEDWPKIQHIPHFTLHLT